MRVEQRTQPVSSQALYRNSKLNPVQKKVVSDIYNTVKTQSKDFESLSPLKWLEDRGHDVLVTTGQSENSVSLKLIPKMDPKAPKVERPVYHIGTYNKEHKFDTEDLKNARKTHVYNATGFYASIAALVGAIAFSVAVEKKASAPKVKQNVETVVNIAKDTVKTLPKDTIAPWK